MSEVNQLAIFPIDYIDRNGLRKLFYVFPDPIGIEFGKQRRNFLIRSQPSICPSGVDRAFQFDLEEFDGGWWRVETIDQLGNDAEFGRCGLPEEVILAIARRFNLRICSSTFEEQQVPKATEVWKRLKRRFDETHGDYRVHEIEGRFWLVPTNNDTGVAQEPAEFAGKTACPTEEIQIIHRTVIAEFCHAPNGHTARRLIDHFRSTQDPQAIADLTHALADSGARLRVPGHVADIASTGGPSSLSTLLCPLFLVVAGFTVPKLGVQGRPAGGIDVMAQFPGFDISPSPEKVRGIIERCRFAHFLADDKYAPLDQALFRFRQELSAQAVRNLVAASILAKKIAVGVETAGLEVRVFPGGNFGQSVQAAVENARFFVDVAALVKIQATCFVTDGTIPYQPLIGRGEAIMALHGLFYGEPSPWVLRHAEQCWGFVRRMCSLDKDQRDIAEILQQARKVFEHHLEAHGASPTDLPGLVSTLNRQNRRIATSPGDGFVIYNLSVIRDFIVQQQRAASGNRFPDPAGVELLKQPRERVVCGEPVLKIRFSAHSEPSEMAERLFSIATAPAMPFEERIFGAN